MVLGWFTRIAYPRCSPHVTQFRTARPGHSLTRRHSWGVRGCSCFTKAESKHQRCIRTCLLENSAGPLQPQQFRSPCRGAVTLRGTRDTRKWFLASWCLAALVHICRKEEVWSAECPARHRTAPDPTARDARGCPPERPLRSTAHHCKLKFPWSQLSDDHHASLLLHKEREQWPIWGADMRLGPSGEASRRGSVSQSESDVANSPAAEAGPCHPASGLLPWGDSARPPSHGPLRD